MIFLSLSLLFFSFFNFKQIGCLPLILITSLSLVLSHHRHFSYFRFIYLICFTILLILQITTTRLATLAEYSGFEKHLFTQRLNEYPPFLAYAAYLWETYLSSPLLNRFIGYFYESINFNNYFPNYFPLFLFPLFFFGLIFRVKRPNRLFNSTFLISLFILTFISPNGRFGPIILFPFMFDLISHPYEIP